eukprot:2720626-Rhodomonas_salina.1
MHLKTRPCRSLEQTRCTGRQESESAASEDLHDMPSFSGFLFQVPLLKGLRAWDSWEGGGREVCGWLIPTATSEFLSVPHPGHSVP